MIIDKSIKDEYYTQLNNKVFPYSTCNTTSCIMGLIQSGTFKYIKELVPEKTQPEDFLTKYMQSKKMVEKMKALSPWSYQQKQPPNQVFVMLEYGINKLANRPIVSMENLSIKQIVLEILSGSGIVLLGKFPRRNGKILNHIVSLAGFKTRQIDIRKARNVIDVDESKIDWFIIDDPYGNYHKDYSGHYGHKGNNVYVPYDDFISIFQPEGHSPKVLLKFKGDQND